MHSITRRHFAAALAGASVLRGAAAPFELPKLPYAVDALEPFIDARTMEIHHGKHHQAYVDNLNKAVAGDSQLAAMPVDELLRKLNTLPEKVRTAVRNHGGGHANHSLFWQTLGPAKNSQPKGPLAQAINKDFGSEAAFEEKLKAAGASVFGSGWAWLTLDGRTLRIEPLPNQDSPLTAGRSPILGIDVWEHAYYLKYQNRRADYLAAILKVVNWDFVSERYQQLARG